LNKSIWLRSGLQRKQNPALLLKHLKKVVVDCNQFQKNKMKVFWEKGLEKVKKLDFLQLKLLEFPRSQERRLSGN